jgi:hypothetical protein
MICYVSGGISALGVAYFAFLPKAAAHDFRGQMALSRFAAAMAVLAGATLLGGLFRQDRELKILTIIFGTAMCLMWITIAAAHFPVA